METDEHNREDVEVIEFDEEVSDNSETDDHCGEELSFDPGKDLWVTVTVNKPGHKALDVEEDWNWEVIFLLYVFSQSVSLTQYVVLSVCLSVCLSACPFQLAYCLNDQA